MELVQIYFRMFNKITIITIFLAFFEFFLLIFFHFFLLVQDPDLGMKMNTDSRIQSPECETISFNLLS